MGAEQRAPRKGPGKGALWDSAEAEEIGSESDSAVPNRKPNSALLSEKLEKEQRSRMMQPTGSCVWGRAGGGRVGA